jgi:radical SAM superfamily enzyme YgiQ (UPF0313 family)
MKIKLYSTSFGLTHDYESKGIRLGLGYLKSNCGDADVEIVEGEDASELKDCDLIGLSSIYHGFNRAIKVLESTDIPVIIGGPLASWEGLSEYNFKHIVRGEGEVAFKSILEGNETEQVIKKPYIKDLDTLNFPYRGNCQSVARVISSRGCLYNCSFCGCRGLWGNIRYHSVEYFIEDVKNILKRHPNIEFLSIQDNMFDTSPERFYKIHDLWMKNDFHKKVKVGCNIRGDFIDEKFANSLKEMNFHHVYIGVDWGRDSSISGIKSKQNASSNNQKVIDLCTPLGIEVMSSMIRGLPGQRLVDLREELEFLKRNRENPFFVPLRYQFAPLPGSPLYNGEDISVINRIRTKPVERDKLI